VQLVDQHPETTRQQKRQLEAVTIIGHHPILEASCKIDNLVYDIDYLVVYLEEHSDMPTNPIRSAETRRTETPNAVMTTLASPSQGPSFGLSLWQVEMQAGQNGPRHIFDSEQIWHVVEGEVLVHLGGDVVTLGAGDVLVMPPGTERQVTATSTARVVVAGHGDAVASVPGEEASRGVPPWIS
jgi:quercetin dioxygenase-like cupin family protein